MTPDDLDTAITCVTTALTPMTSRNWSEAPGTGEWTAWHTAEHIGDCLLSYAAQVVAQPTTHYVRFLAKADEDATPADLLEFATAGAGILSATLHTTSPTTRAYHPSGLSDPEGFTAMASVEILIHGTDIARGLGTSITPPSDLCTRILLRLFPHVDVRGIDPWTALLWATNRIDLPGKPRQTAWHWQGTPLT
ncbi:DinB family protein [Actinokineospora globicatena]|uniref:DinB family protein n=1 Tax=Actinokineospora globicatena TaxID=103729 RepID=UPI0020A60ECD|nr:DinB family protein [Actinokineospora globicatena]MCP2303332.1 TIGR03083 family protein [Actinokineospora globicatena]GLW79535.1 hypothetical protein Aglo01_40170 [Actinokineospora globicatena]GLW86055.1 hypothetical protein Aglo02_36940 [Actinokineospora globicatena]